ARAVQNAAVKAGGRLDLGVTEANFAVLRDCPVPACLIEVAFISNPEEEKLLADPAFRSRIAMGIFEGIKAYLTSK
ncbi:MAG: N-acetylmuramoyl-L-alanine amidase, partial [Clostridia bacterium]|nr:N-acetylmuramoyl-L-alanine amidase [Clostridia bacterium]